jgi:hypothetical protein
VSATQARPGTASGAHPLRGMSATDRESVLQVRHWLTGGGVSIMWVVLRLFCGPNIGVIALDLNTGWPFARDARIPVRVTATTLESRIGHNRCTTRRGSAPPVMSYNP